jgi:hypothetical protein
MHAQQLFTRYGGRFEMPQQVENTGGNEPILHRRNAPGSLGMALPRVMPQAVRVGDVGGSQVVYSLS